MREIVNFEREIDLVIFVDSAFFFWEHPFMSNCQYMTSDIEGGVENVVG